jgi:hypothetical protein
LLQAQLSGSYTIGPTGNYSIFNAAVNALTSQGVAGAVTFLAEPGTYTDNISLCIITSASHQNRITFQSLNTNDEDVNITFIAPGTKKNYLWKFFGVNHITRWNLTIHPIDRYNERILEFWGHYNNLVIKNIFHELTTINARQKNP